MKRQGKPVEIKAGSDGVTITFNGVGWTQEHTRLLEDISGRNHKHGNTGTGLLMSMLDSYINTLYPKSYVDDVYENALDTRQKILEDEAREAAGLPPKGLKFHEP